MRWIAAPLRPNAGARACRARALGLAAAILFLAAPALGAGEKDDEIVAEFRRYYDPKLSVRERIEAVLVLRGVNSLAAAQALADVFDDPDFKVREAAVETIGTYTDPAAAQFLIDTFLTNKREKKIQRLACAAEAAGRMGAPAAAAPLADLFRRTKDWELQRAIAAAFGSLKAPEGIAVVEELLSDKDPTLRIVACEALAGINRPDLCQDALFSVMAGDADWQVRAAAIAAVRAMRFKDAIQPLIDRLREEEGRLRGDAYEALKEITFCTYDDDPEAWQKFWDAARETWQVPDSEKIMAEREKRAREGTRYSRPAAQFIGIPTKSKRIIFVIDISGSMETQVVEVERFRAGGKEYANFQRLEIVKAELIATIESLEDGVDFNIIAFATSVEWWKKKLVGANILNRNSAVKFVERLAPVGGAMAGFRSRAGLSAGLEEGKTNTYGALMAALGVSEDDAGATYDRRLGDEVDTIYFLSDGEPTVGKVIDKDEIRAEVKRANKVRKIAVHTIAIGDFRKDFMKALAAENNGIYVDLGK